MNARDFSVMPVVVEAIQWIVGFGEIRGGRVSGRWSLGWQSGPWGAGSSGCSSHTHFASRQRLQLKIGVIDQGPRRLAEGCRLARPTSTEGKFRCRRPVSYSAASDARISGTVSVVLLGWHPDRPASEAPPTNATGIRVADVTVL
jgi:hypothetical protein